MLVRNSHFLVRGELALKLILNMGRKRNGSRSGFQMAYLTYVPNVHPKGDSPDKRYKDNEITK